MFGSLCLYFIKHYVFRATVCKTVRPMLSVRCLSVYLSCLSCLSVTFVHCGNRTNQDDTWRAGRPRPGHIELDGDPAPPPQRGTALCQFSAHTCCGQMAAWIKMSLGMELGLGQGDFVVDGDHAAPPQKGRSPQIFGPCLLRPNGWMDETGTWHEGRPHPRQLCVRWGPSPLSPKWGRSPLPNFRPISIVTKRLDASRCHLVWV